jgi:hypothetical protein
VRLSVAVKAASRSSAEISRTMPLRDDASSSSPAVASARFVTKTRPVQSRTATAHATSGGKAPSSGASPVVARRPVAATSSARPGPGPSSSASLRWSRNPLATTNTVATTPPTVVCIVTTLALKATQVSSGAAIQSSARSVSATRPRRFT